MSVLVVLAAGTFASVQDRGRFGQRADGIPQAGALDTGAYDLANAFVGNDPAAAALEVIYGGLKVRFEGAVCFAVTGAQAETRLDGVVVGASRVQAAPAGAILEIGVPRRQTCTYLAVAGGIDVPVVLGSRSTDVGAGFGGFEGRPLRAGDRVRLGDPGPRRVRPLAIGEPSPGEEPPVQPIRMIPGGEEARLSREGRERFWQTQWRVSAQRNRLGMRLTGPPLPSLGDEEIRSQAVFPGLVQLPPAGEPIALLADAPVTGGYPRLGAVISADLGTLAQLAIGSALQFVAVDRDVAVRARRERGFSPGADADEARPC